MATIESFYKRYTKDALDLGLTPALAKEYASAQVALDIMDKRMEEDPSIWPGIRSQYVETRQKWESLLAMGKTFKALGIKGVVEVEA